MAPRANKTQKSVTFTEEATDQALLETVEQVLTQPQAGNFSDLCKKALGQFLLPAEPPHPTASLLQLAQQLIELQRQFIKFQEALPTREDYRFHQIEQQLHQLTQQVGQLEAKVAQGLAPIAETVETTVNGSDLAEPSMREPDPLLRRLGPLLDDF